jgi:hypothetical protein
MANDLTTSEPDDGFEASHSRRASGRSGNYLRWNDKQHWLDRDGITPPSPLLVIAVGELLRRWKDNQREDIVDKPLPNPDALNASIPVSEWEASVDGKPRPPWSHTVAVYFANLNTGETYKYEAPTTGAHIAHDALTESVTTMRALRGTKCMPLVNLGERPMKMKFGMGMRPHFEIIGWKTPGDDGAAIAAPSTSLLTSSVVTAVETVPSEPKADPISSGPPLQAKAKPPVNATLTAMGDVKPVTVGEIMDDEIPW